MVRSSPWATARRRRLAERRARRDGKPRAELPRLETGLEQPAHLLRRLHGGRLTDLGPYRAVRGDLLRGLGMRPSRFAWPAEMLARAARRGARIVEVEVGYRRRSAGTSKVGGNLRGSLEAGAGIVGTLVGQWLGLR